MNFTGSLNYSILHSSWSELKKISLKLTSRDEFIALQINDVFVVSDTFFFNRYLFPHKKKLLSVYAELEEMPQLENINNEKLKKSEFNQYVSFDEDNEGGEPSITFHIPIKFGQAEEIIRYLCTETLEVEFSFYLDDLVSPSNLLESTVNVWNTAPEMPATTKIKSFSIYLRNFNRSKLSLLESIKLNDGLSEASIRLFEKIGSLSSNEKQVFLLDRILDLIREMRAWLLLIVLLLLASIYF